MSVSGGPLGVGMTGKTGTGVAVGLLGPFTASCGGQPVALTAGRLRTVLAVLALSAGEPVSVDRLAMALWDEDLPADSRRAVQVYVTRLRRALGPAAIATTSAGYRLVVEPDQVDAVRFVHLLDEAAGNLGTDIERERIAEALALWRGTPFEGVRSSWLAEGESTRLVERWTAAVQRRAELDLAEGRLGEVIAELRELTARYPLRERFWGLLMTALYRADRRADALQAYQDLYRLLADELGIEPGQPVQDLHRQILTADASLDPPPGSDRVPVPRQLPAVVGDFTGRAGELERLDALVPGVDDVPPGAAVVIAVISGTAGVGKTALAVHWAHRVVDRFPDGQLYVDLRGFGPSDRPVNPDAALRGFLSALGVPPHRIPADPAAQVGLYRSAMAGRRMLVLLDNARDADQVRPLLPGTAGCLAVVTSRSQLSSLVAAEGARALVLDVLPTEDALCLLASRIGAARIAADRLAAEELAESCARLPLALAIVAARAAIHPAFPLAALTTELRDARSRLDTLVGDDAASDVRAVFSWSYRTLSPDTARLFRLLGLHPGPDTSAPAAASLAGLPVARARPLLAELAQAHLVVEHAPGRYAFHDLLRAYATELAHADEADDRRVAAVHRILDHYLHATHAANVLLNPHRDHPIAPAEPRPGVTLEQLGDRRDALAWLAAEYPVLVATIDLAAATGMDTCAWQLAWSLSGFLSRCGRWQEWAVTQELALESTYRLGDRSEQARVHRGLSQVYLSLGRFDDARTQLEHALRLYDALGDLTGLAHTYTSYGDLYDSQDRPADALDQAQRALRLFRRINDAAGQALARNAVGWCHARLGNHDQALSYCQQALESQQRLHDQLGEASTWDSLAYIHRHLNNLPEAIECYRRSLALRRELGQRYGEAKTLVRLADTHHAAGEDDVAGKIWRQAITVLDELDPDEAHRVRESLRAR
jgi:DNA-binding SARP family transcriptional activator